MYILTVETKYEDARLIWMTLNALLPDNTYKIKNGVVAENISMEQVNRCKTRLKYSLGYLPEYQLGENFVIRRTETI